MGKGFSVIVIGDACLEITHFFSLFRVSKLFSYKFKFIRDEMPENCGVDVVSRYSEIKLLCSATF